jgi:hypothetical protein
MKHPLRSAALLAALFLPALLPRPAAAQVVRGELVERGSSRPIGGALVILVDSAGGRIATSITDAAGNYVLHAPRAGTYTLRSERVGFRSVTSSPLVLRVDEERRFRMEGDAAVVSLAGITATSERRCRARPGSGPGTAVLWEEARKALSAAAAAEQASLLRYDVETYWRDLAAGTLTVMADNRKRQSGMARSPFRSRSLDSLSTLGYVREEGDSIAFDAPDAHVLLSDRFLAEHCFRVEDEGAGPGEVGLAFEPVRSREVAEVAGVLWMDRATAELRRLEYRYVNVDREVASNSGGRVEFTRLPSGAWVVSRWYIRMPLFRQVASFSPGFDAASVRNRPRNRLVAIREEGGEILGSSVREMRGVGRTGRVAGMVWDSLGVRPLPGAQVFLSGTSWSAISDSVGRFAIEGVPEGRYALSFSHPALAMWGAVAAPSNVEVPRAGDDPVIVSTPSLETVLARTCKADDFKTHPGAAMGVVTREGRPQARARVQLTWRWFNPMTRTLRDSGTRVETNDRGFYAVCGIPADVRIDIEVTPADAQATFAEQLNLLGERFARKDMALVAGQRGP